MLQQVNKSQSENGFGAGGRPNHSHWYGFRKKMEGGRNVAQCLKCQQLIRNTAGVRMQAHRKNCPLEQDDSIQEGSSYTQFQQQQAVNDDEVSQINRCHTPKSRRSSSCLNEPMFNVDDIVECKQEKIDTSYANHLELQRMDMLSTAASGGISSSSSVTPYAAYRTSDNAKQMQNRKYEEHDNVCFLNHLDSILNKLPLGSSESLQAKVMAMAYEELAKHREYS